MTFGIIPSSIYPSRSSPAWSFLSSHPNSVYVALSLPPTSDVCKNLSSGATPFSFACKAASHLLSSRAFHNTPSFSGSLTSFFRSFLHMRHLVYVQKHNRLNCSLAPLAFGRFYYPYSSQKSPYRMVLLPEQYFQGALLLLLHLEWYKYAQTDYFPERSRRASG